MHLTAGDWINLVHAVAWPAVLITLAIVYRHEIPKLVQALAGRVSKFGAAGVTLEFVSAKAVEETLRLKLDELRKPVGDGLQTGASGEGALVQLARSFQTDYLTIDLRDGRAWLTSRLYLFARILPEVVGVRCFVFVGDRGTVPHYFLGLASPDAVTRALEKRYPWLREVWIEMQIQPYNDYGVGKPVVDQLMAPAAPTESKKDVPALVSDLISLLVQPIDLSQPGQVEYLLWRYLDHSKMKRKEPEPGSPPVDLPPPAEGWVRLGKSPLSFDEHASWIGDERKLLDCLGGVTRARVVRDQTSDEDSLVKAVLRQSGNFVAVTDPEGRFERLIDRSALAEKAAARQG